MNALATRLHERRANRRQNPAPLPDCHVNSAMHDGIEPVVIVVKTPEPRAFVACRGCRAVVESVTAVYEDQRR